MAWSSKIIRWASVFRAGKDTDSYPVQQITYLGKTSEAVMLFPYGMHANVDGDAIGPMFTMNGNMENRGMLPTSMTRRSKLVGGDVELYSPVSRSRVTIRYNGGAEIDATSFTVTATTSMAVTTPTASFSNDVLVGNDLTVAGTAQAATVAATAGFSIGGVPGVSGTFTTTDGKTVTVTSGVITSIV